MFSWPEGIKIILPECSGKWEKSPEDGLTIDDFYKAAAYACLYKSLGQTVDQYPGTDITVSLFREAYPRDLFAALRAEGRSIEEKYPGIYYVTGNVMFDTQIVVTGRLAADSHSPLRILSGHAGKEDVRRFLEEISALKTPGDRNNADAVLQVSISANRSLYDDLRKWPSSFLERGRPWIPSRS